MHDHVARMVHTWFERAQSAEDAREVLSELITAIHRMIREAEHEIRRRCEDIAVEVGGAELGGRVALAIRTADQESLPRRSLIEIYAPDLTQS